jgi:hypothetical protein
MRDRFCRLLSLALVALSLGCAQMMIARGQNSAPPAAAKRGDFEHTVQLQLLVASTPVHTKTEYPTPLESIVRQLKTSLSYKAHRLVATYLYNVADGSNLEVNDVTYAPLEMNGGLVPTFFTVGIAGIKLNEGGNSVHLSRFKFEARKRIFTENVLLESNTTRPVFNTVTTGISTELNLSAGVPTIVGTTTSGLSDGVLVLVLTVNQAEMH